MIWHRFFRRKRADVELMEEIDSYMSEEIAENVARGVTEQEARRRAWIKFGNAGAVRETLWRQNTPAIVDTLVRDLRYAARTLGRTPGFTAIAILVIAIGIGANVTLLTTVHSVLLNPLPFRDSDQLMRIYEGELSVSSGAVTGAMFSEWKSQSHSFSDLAIGGAATYNLSGSGEQLPENVRAATFAWNVLPTLGVQPALGRNFTAEEDRPSANPTVLLSWGLWKRRFGGDPAIVNRNIILDARSYTVVGVMPAWFDYPDSKVQLWTPVYYASRMAVMRDLEDHEFWVLGRLRPGATPAEGIAELALITRRVHDQHRSLAYVGKTASGQSLLESLVGNLKRPLYILLGATGCVLLIACLNVGNLLVARAASRRKEQAIRMALGGRGLQLIRQHLMESLLLSGAGGAGGLLLASVAIQWLIHERPDMMRVQAIHIDGFGIACTAGLIVLCTFFAGLVSAFNARGDQALSTLQSSRSHSAGGESVQMRTALLSLQVAVTVVLLIVAGLLLKSYDKLLSAGLGCSTTNVLKMDLQLPKARYGDPASVERFFESLLREVRSLPGIQAAGLIYGGVPGEGYGPDNGFTIVEHPELPPDQRPYAIQRWVDPGYFAAMGIPLRSGHTFDDNQRLGHATEVIVSESFARKYFAEEDAVGRHIRITDSRSYEIVAVVGDARFAPGEPARPIMYSELLVDPQESSTTLVIRSGPDALQSAMPVQSVIWKLDPDLPVSNVLTMDQVVSRNTLNVSFDASLLSAFAGLSLLLAGAGLFGVLSYIVAQRTSEIGIRIALGARREQLLRLMLMDGLRPAFVGLALGSAVSAGITQLIRSTLYDSTALDLPVFAAVAVLLLWVAALACLIPAWRASRLDPMQALRSE